MKKQQIIALLVLAMAAGLVWYGHKSWGVVSGTSTASQPKCDASLWAHVYKSDRLEQINPCIQVSGVIDEVKMEEDGDYHIRVKLDSGYEDLLNLGNKKLLQGDLLIEPVCENPVENPDAKGACSNFYGSIGIPPVGTHIIVSGSYVLDKTHGWNEIHPVSTLISK